MGSGGLFFDADNDGWIDIFLVDGGSEADPAVARMARHRLFRNRTASSATSAKGRSPMPRSRAASDLRHCRTSASASCSPTYDNDGDLDMLATSNGGAAARLAQRRRQRAGGVANVKTVSKSLNL
jgi:hypothetical protein